MRTLEVRTRDSAGDKLLGWVDVPDHMNQEGRVLTAAIRDPLGNALARDEAPSVHVEATVHPVDFPVVRCDAGFGGSYLAIQAAPQHVRLIAQLLAPWNYRRAP